MLKEKYESAEMQVTEFATEDVITSSTPTPTIQPPVLEDNETEIMRP